MINAFTTNLFSINCIIRGFGLGCWHYYLRRWQKLLSGRHSSAGVAYGYWPSNPKISQIFLKLPIILCSLRLFFSCVGKAPLSAIMPWGSLRLFFLVWALRVPHWPKCRGLLKTIFFFLVWALSPPIGE